MTIDKERVKRSANLSRVELSEEEVNELSGQLKEILDFIDKLKALDIKGIEPMSHVFDISNVLRDDAPVIPIPAPQAVSNAPEKEDNFFVVPKVIE